MSLSCSCTTGDFAWYYERAQDFAPLATRRSRKCCSCGSKVKPGDEALKFFRWRPPRNIPPYIEERIHGDEVPLAPWYMCETCGGLFFAVDDLGMCCDIGEPIAQQIKEYRQLEAESKARKS